MVLAAPDAATLLDWYDRHRRTLPWRAPPGHFTDPYHVWLSEVMLQQTTVKAVIPYFLAFTGRWPTVGELAAAPRDDVLAAWAGLGYYARARNLHACALVVAQHHGGHFPDTEKALRQLPGVGEYTAAAIAAIAFGRSAIVVDGNVERVMARMTALETPMPKGKRAVRDKLAPITPDDHPEGRPGDFAQAMMDLGATICTPKSPACVLCPWRGGCRAAADSTQDRYPVKAAKAPKPVRRGTAFVVRNSSGAVMLRTRADTGLLGGMAEVPSTPWVPDTDDAATVPPVAADWRVLEGEVRHVFTHFELRLSVWAGGADTAPAGCRFVAVEDLAG
ncbi:MAG: A/G-specific adenine glycosylase, partial [Pseudomonadota bacterium]